MGRRLARRLGYRFLDTGPMYRALTWLALRRGIDPEDEEALADLASKVRVHVRGLKSGRHRIWVDGEEATLYLRTPEVERAVSPVSRVAAVRQAMVAHQRRLARPPVVMAGRDIGTTVLPKADLKVFLNASVEERARRRHQELLQQAKEASLEGVLEELRRRDRIDSQRKVSPLRPAPDAIILDTDRLSEDQVLDRVLDLVRRRLAGPSTSLRLRPFAVLRACPERSEGAGSEGLKPSALRPSGRRPEGAGPGGSGTTGGG